MGHYCRICGRVRANERFTGRGHRDHVCKDCQRLPRGERDRIEQLDELHCFLGQSNISAKNIARLRVLSASAGEEVRQLAALVLDIALVHPRKRRRLKFLVGQRWDIFARMHAVLGAEYFDDFMDGCGPHDDWLLEVLERVAGKNPPSQAAHPVASPASSAASPSARCDQQTGRLKEVTIFTDGGCQGNPGPGGWAAVLRYGAHVKELAGGEPATTNNRMELTAAIEALAALKRPCAVDLFTDSEYLRNGITQWMARWKVNGWRTIDRKPVKNEGLWRKLDALCVKHQVQWRWLKGHAGHADNERCDRLARAEISELRRRLAANRLASAVQQFNQQHPPQFDQARLA